MRDEPVGRRDDRVGRIFTHNELYFASPSLFNDPFDCKVNVSIEDATQVDFELYYKNLNKEPGISESEHAAKAQ